MLEAARQGVPVVCFEDGGGAPEFVDDSVGATVPMLDVAGMAQAVKDLKAAPEVRARLGNRAYEKSLTYSTARMGNGIYDVLKAVVSPKGPARRTPPRG
jgi:glycosyltransferase involved in cell wall biosynthesis